MKLNKRASRPAALILTALMLFNMWPAAAAAEDSADIYIGNLRELKAFAEKCSSDTYSKGLTVALTNDIDLKGERVSVPIFLGTFDGREHRIYGLKIQKKESETGLFSRIEKGAVVKDLTVEGEVTPDGVQSNVGGIAGENYGSIENCSFSGAAEGSENVGGIAGYNSKSGVISGCSTYGLVRGSSMTGGVAGKNQGTIIRCSNDASVNTTVDDEDIDEDDLKNMENNVYKVLKDEKTTETAVTTDTGGIAGFSDGAVQSCVNTGAVGYEHTGYNVGGIAGRQRGYIASCKNHGKIQGRKDTGGIVGQLEPDVTLHVSGDDLDDLQSELDTLQSYIDRAVDDAQGASDTVSESVSRISDHAGDASESADALSDRLSDFTDENIDVANNMKLIAERYTDRLEPITDEMNDAADDMIDTIDQMQKLLDMTDDVSGYSDKALSQMRSACRSMISACGDMSKAADEMEKAFKIIKGGPAAPDTKQLRADIASLKSAASSLEDSIDKALEEYKSSGAVSDATKAEISGGTEKLLDAYKAVWRSMADVVKNTDIKDLADQNVQNIKDTAAHLKNAMDSFSDAASDMEDAMDQMEKALKNMQEISDEMDDIKDQADDALASMKTAASSFKKAMKDASQWAKDLSDEDPGSFSALGSEFDDDSDSLSKSLTSINNELSSLNGEMSDINSTISADIRKVSDQFMKVMNMFIDMMKDARDMADSDIFEDITVDDVSLESLKNTTRGKVLECVNNGEVVSDRNAGGIAGAMAVELSNDPEDDRFSLEGVNAVKFTYQTRAITLDCDNYGKIKAAKSCAGGIVGRMDLGTVYGCGGWGDVKAENGDNAGGVCGLSLSAVRNSYAKCFLSGERYVGGIVGSGSSVLNCMSMAQIDSCDQYGGAIAGEITDRYSGNIFASDTLAGVDRMSISGKADKVSKETLRSMESAPDEFRKLTLTFMVDTDDEDDSGDDDEDDDDSTDDGDYDVVKKQSFDYGESFDESVFPDVKQKENKYVNWDRADLTELTEDTVVRGKYKTYVTTLASSAERDGRPVILAEGKFRKGDSIKAEKQAAPQLVAGKALEAWSVELPDDGQEPHRIRWQIDKDADPDKLSAYVRTDGKWKKADSEVIGSYLCFDAGSGSSAVAIAETGGRKAAVAVATAVFACLAGAVCAVLFICRRRAKKQ